jgi:hypothetical protein
MRTIFEININTPEGQLLLIAIAELKKHYINVTAQDMLDKLLDQQHNLDDILKTMIK